MFKKQLASKERVKLMIGLTGPSGAGKTYSALQMAYGITGDWTKIAVADTENRSALYYAGERTGAWEHIEFPSGKECYHPQNWIKLIEYAESDPKTEVLILDSISHEWAGCLELNTKLGGRFIDWSKVTPLHNAFIDKMRNSRLHIIATMRVKTDYAIEQNDKGKPTPVKIGLKSVQREDSDYEFGLIFDIDTKHLATSTKDRTGLFLGSLPFLITSELGKQLVEWANEGKASAREKAEADERLKELNIQNAKKERLNEKLKELNIPEEEWASVFEEMKRNKIPLSKLSDLLTAREHKES